MPVQVSVLLCASSIHVCRQDVHTAVGMLLQEPRIHLVNTTPWIQLHHHMNVKKNQLKNALKNKLSQGPS